MEENKNYENQGHNTEHQNCWLCKHPIFKHMLIGFLVFLGAYLAFYTVTDWHFKKMLDPAFQMRNVERKLIQSQHQMEKMYRQNFDKEYQLGQKTAGYIRLEKRNDAYEVIVNLRPFDNNDKNVEFSTNDNTLTVTAAGEKSSQHNEKIIKIMQRYDFDDSVDLEAITTMRKGDNYIITIPIIK